MSSILTIQFPEDFEEQYDAYKAGILGHQANAVKISQPTTDGAKKFPHKLPSGTIWKNFIVQFLSDEKVFIQVAGKKEELDYKAMGFEDKRSGRPDSQWKFLLVLAKLHGEISRKDIESDDNFKKHKERLTNTLQNYFSIDSDPFHPYAGKQSYQIKLILVPPPSNENEPQTLEEETDEIFKDFSSE